MRKINLHGCSLPQQPPHDGRVLAVELNEHAEPGALGSRENPQKHVIMESSVTAPCSSGSGAGNASHQHSHGFHSTQPAKTCS